MIATIIAHVLRRRNRKPQSGGLVLTFCSVANRHLPMDERTKHQMMQRLRGERRDGYPADVTMRWAAEEIERLEDRLAIQKRIITDHVESERALSAGDQR
jgi:hypothetical protein